MECKISVCVCRCVGGGGGVQSKRVEGVGDLLAVLIFVVHGAFEPQARKVLEHKIVVLGNAAGERDTGLVSRAAFWRFQIESQA